MVVVTIDTRSAVIDFEKILEAVSIEPDDTLSDAPWDNCDGFEHTLRLPRIDCETDSEACIHHDGRYRIFDVPYDTDLYNWHRKNGASRQVAREAVALSRQQVVLQLKRWYEHGWEWWRVGCQYLDASASVCGVDDYRYASEEGATEIAEEVAAELETAGYTVANRPGLEDRRAAYLENRRYHLRQNLLIGTWR